MLFISMVCYEMGSRWARNQDEHLPIIASIDISVLPRDEDDIALCETVEDFRKTYEAEIRASTLAARLSPRIVDKIRALLTGAYLPSSALCMYRFISILTPCSFPWTLLYYCTSRQLDHEELHPVISFTFSPQLPSLFACCCGSCC